MGDFFVYEEDSVTRAIKVAAITRARFLMAEDPPTAEVWVTGSDIATRLEGPDAVTLEQLIRKNSQIPKPRKKVATPTESTPMFRE